MRNTHIYLSFLVLLLAGGCSLAERTSSELSGEQYRPQVHFTPEKNGMSGPVEIILREGVYHLYYPCNPENERGNVSHWGHATATDLLHWEHHPAVLSPDGNGAILSGCIVFDEHNTSGLGSVGNPPLVSLFTYHDYGKEEQGAVEVESQGLAYSLDNGYTWQKYEKNPVLPNPGIRDFKNPKVFWYEAGKRWIMTLAADNRISIYTSPDLCEWTYESSFGKGLGQEGDIWDTPDLFEMPVGNSNESKWICVVNIGFGISGEWGTGYFPGSFDGSTFSPDQTEPIWVDHGKDFYSGRTSLLPGGRRLLTGWMNNWEYATESPASLWMGAVSIPRNVSLEKVGARYLLKAGPVEEIKCLNSERVVISAMDIAQDVHRDGVENVTGMIPFGILPSDITLRFDIGGKIGRIGFAEKFGIRFSNPEGESVSVGYDCFNRRFYIDRRNAAARVFSDKFAAIHILPYAIESLDVLDLRIILDKSSVEMFVMDGKGAMTDTFYPSSGFNKVEVFAENGKVSLAELSVTELKSVWKEKE
ncbi:glycoside hydrolase family 32 protein [uncultured Parabacteroides sp.]|uniref:glycoside hydrolase family 32 protein n=1 Tax=uncultured Parabacteroides sp. TaxID=512312 RepID=UPI0025EFC049|nr:glycoside hydrolase family 32 protein [uncultured Parabacteroides sp.]